MHNRAFLQAGRVLLFNRLRWAAAALGVTVASVSRSDRVRIRLWVEQKPRPPHVSSTAWFGTGRLCFCVAITLTGQQGTIVTW